MSLIFFEIQTILKYICDFYFQISPEGAQKHAQQGAMVADALMNEMGKCVRDMFTNAHKDMKQLPEGKVSKFIELYIYIMKPIRLCVCRIRS